MKFKYLEKPISDINALFSETDKEDRWVVCMMNKLTNTETPDILVSNLSQCAYDMMTQKIDNKSDLIFVVKYRIKIDEKIIDIWDKGYNLVAEKK